MHFVIKPRGVDKLSLLLRAVLVGVDVVSMAGRDSIGRHVLLLLLVVDVRLVLRVEQQEEEADDELHQLHDGQHGDAHPQTQGPTDVGEEVGQTVGRELAVLHHAEVLQVDVEPEEVLADEVGGSLGLLFLGQCVALLEEVVRAGVVTVGHELGQVGQLGEEGVGLVHEVLLDVGAVEQLWENRRAVRLQWTLFISIG